MQQRHGMRCYEMPDVSIFYKYGDILSLNGTARMNFTFICSKTVVRYFKSTMNDSGKKHGQTYF